MTPRSIRRAAERRAKKLARKAQPAAAIAAEPIPDSGVSRTSSSASDLPPAPAITPVAAETSARLHARPTPITRAQLLANRANAQLSTGPRTPEGLAVSSQNAVKSALTGRTVLLSTEDVEEYARFLAEFQQHYNPVGIAECQLVQAIVDCHWRLNRIQELEHALYARGHRQFEAQFAEEPETSRHSMIVLETHLAYQKELRNLHIQESRIDRKRRNALTELESLQAGRTKQNRDRDEAEDPAAPFASEADFFAALDAGYIPPRLAAYMVQEKSVSENGFDFSNAAVSNKSGQSKAA